MRVREEFCCYVIKLSEKDRESSFSFFAERAWTALAERLEISLSLQNHVNIITLQTSTL